MQEMHKNVHANLALVLLLVHTEAEYGKGLLNRLTSVFHSAVVLLIMNFRDYIVKVAVDPQTTLTML